MDIARSIGKSATIGLQNGQFMLERLVSDINLNAQGALTNQNHHLQTEISQIKLKSKQHLELHSNQINYIEKTHHQLNPETTLKRGKSIKKKKLKKGQNLTTYTINQKIESSITSIDKNE